MRLLVMVAAVVMIGCSGSDSSGLATTQSRSEPFVWKPDATPTPTPRPTRTPARQALMDERERALLESPTPTPSARPPTDAYTYLAQHLNETHSEYRILGNEEAGVRANFYDGVADFMRRCESGELSAYFSKWNSDNAPFFSRALPGSKYVGRYASSLLKYKNPLEYETPRIVEALTDQPNLSMLWEVREYVELGFAVHCVYVKERVLNDAQVSLVETSERNERDGTLLPSVRAPHSDCLEGKEYPLAAGDTLFLVDAETADYEQSIVRILPACDYVLKVEHANKEVGRQCREAFEALGNNWRCWVEVYMLTYLPPKEWGDIPRRIEMELGTK